jgi:hypothetical protein
MVGKVKCIQNREILDGIAGPVKRSEGQVFYSTDVCYGIISDGKPGKRRKAGQGINIPLDGVPRQIQIVEFRETG